MILVTGHKGFIGSYFNKGDVVVVEKDKALDFVQIFNDWDKIEMVYHLGGISDTTEKDLKKLFDYNINFSIELFKRCIEHKIPVKYASSASVYGNTPNIINPLNYYAMSKATVDLWVEDNLDKFEHVQGFRFFNVYGKGEDHKLNQSSPVSKFIKDAIEKKIITVFEGSEKIFRDFICVEDVVNVVMHNNKPSGIYDLGTSNPVSFAHIAECVQKRYGGEIKQIPFPEHLKNKYQYYTKAQKVFDYEFKTVESWISMLD